MAAAAVATATVEFDSTKIYQNYLQNRQVTPKYEGMSNAAIIDDLFKYEQVYEEDDGFFIYHVPSPFFATFNNSFIFQHEQSFSYDWYEECDEYIKNLSRRELYILKRYTRHGDEIVNKLLRDPEGFADDKRIQELVFEKMPDEHFMLYAMELIDMFNPGQHMDYLTNEGIIPAMEYHELEVLEAEYLGEQFIADPKQRLEQLKPLIYRYIDDLREILYNAPPITKPLQVFRATNTDYLNKPFDAATMHGFTSTSLDSCIGETYHMNRYIYQMMILPGTPCLSIKNASRYYNEFEVLLDTHCFAMPTELYEKHTLQTDIETGHVDMTHVLASPRNIKHNVRYIQVTGTGLVGSKASKGSKGSRRSSKGSKGSRGSRGSRSKTSKGGRYAKTARVLHQVHPMKKVSRKVSARISRTSRKSRKSTSTRKMKVKDAWKYRDQSAPRIVYGTVPAEVKERLLNAHKKMGTYLHNVSR